MALEQREDLLQSSQFNPIPRSEFPTQTKYERVLDFLFLSLMEPRHLPSIYVRTLGTTFSITNTTYFKPEQKCALGVLLQTGVIELDNDSVQPANDNFHFGDLHSFNGSNVLDSITTCILSTCQNTSDATCDVTVRGNITKAYNPEYNITEKLQRLFVGFSLYCDGAGAKPNSDLFGPGVIFSSLLQSSAVAFFFLVSKIHRMARRLKLRGRGNVEANDVIDPFQSGPTSRFFSATEAIMTMLQRSGRHWWYTTALSSVTSALGWWALLQPREVDYAAVWAKLGRDNSVSQCGGNPDPIAYCVVYSTQMLYAWNKLSPGGPQITFILRIFPGLATMPILVVAIMVPLFLFGNQLYTWFQARQHWERIVRFCKRASGWNKLQKSTKDRISKLWPCFVWLSGGWTYGQLVASLVWAPSGLKFLYYIIFGVEKGVSNRIGERYHVQRESSRRSLATDTAEEHLIGDMSRYMSVIGPNNGARISQDYGGEAGPGQGNANAQFAVQQPRQMPFDDYAAVHQEQNYNVVRNIPEWL
ncbi:hypothetical protein CIB48_g5188 [Xylaria polymorpha]|nr:hypothetical protein CIB48_g5188 [Xylaria polymorpha]